MIDDGEGEVGETDRNLRLEERDRARRDCGPCRSEAEGHLRHPFRAQSVATQCVQRAVRWGGDPNGRTRQHAQQRDAATAAAASFTGIGASTVRGAVVDDGHGCAVQIEAVHIKQGENPSEGRAGGHAMRGEGEEGRLVFSERKAGG